MRALKKKTPKGKESNQRKGASAAIPSTSSTAMVAPESVKFWNETVKILRQKKFSTLSEALDVLLELVLGRLQGDRVVTVEEKEFLRELLESDEAIMDQLKVLMTVR